MADVVQRIAMKGLIVDSEGRVLIIREAATYGDGTQRGRYHLPGGRLEPGENFEDGLRREIREETGLEVIIGRPIYVGEWRPVIHDVPHQIVGIFFLCTLKGVATVRLSNEHDAFEWIVPGERQQFDIMDPEDKVIDSFAKIL